MEEKKIIIVSVGGSLIVPAEIDTDFLKNFKELILSRPERFVLITGGGKTCRNYHTAAREVHELTNEDADWIGIHTTRLNAQLVRTIFKEHSHPRIIFDPTQRISFREKILVAAGWKPGCSTDYDAVLLAKNIGVGTVVNLSNIDYVYDKDPKKFRDAKKLEELSWKEFRKIVGDEWDPGMNAPFDPVASREAEKLGLKVVIINGKKIDNFKKFLGGKAFKGTTIK